MTSHELLRVKLGGSLSIYAMNLQSQSRQISPFPFWIDFELQNENRAFVDRDSKFLFHYEDGPFGRDYEELKDFPTDEYEEKKKKNHIRH